MFGQPKNNPNNLRVIKTARTLDSINAGAEAGFRPLVQPVEPSEDIHHFIGVFQHKETGAIKVSGDCRGRFGEDYKCVIPYHFYYPYKYPAPYAAYLLPPDLVEGERVWLEDVIEDIVSVYGNQGWHPRLECCEAIWKNGKFDIQFDPAKDARRLLG